jgi:hypothetical protein
LPGAAHKRDALLVFIRARSLAHENQRGVFVSNPEHQLVAPFMQPAALAISDIRQDLE